MVSLMAIHQHIISQDPGKGCRALFSTLFNIPINSHEIQRQQGQDPRSPIHGREHRVSLHSSLQRVQRDLQELYSRGLFILYLHWTCHSRSWSMAQCLSLDAGTIDTYDKNEVKPHIITMGLQTGSDREKK